MRNIKVYVTLVPSILIRVSAFPYPPLSTNPTLSSRERIQPEVRGDLSSCKAGAGWTSCTSHSHPSGVHFRVLTLQKLSWLRSLAQHEVTALSRSGRQHHAVARAVSQGRLPGFKSHISRIHRSLNISGHQTQNKYKTGIPQGAGISPPTWRSPLALSRGNGICTNVYTSLVVVRIELLHEENVEHHTTHDKKYRCTHVFVSVSASAQIIDTIFVLLTKHFWFHFLISFLLHKAKPRKLRKKTNLFYFHCLKSSSLKHCLSHMQKHARCLTPLFLS